MREKVLRLEAISKQSLSDIKVPMGNKDYLNNSMEFLVKTIYKMSTVCITKRDIYPKRAIEIKSKQVNGHYLYPKTITINKKITIRMKLGPPKGHFF